MPDCTILFYRHSHVDGIREKPTAFAADKLRPLIERCLNGSRLHVIHDRVPSMPLFEGVKENFERNLKVKQLVRALKGFERDWRLHAKNQLSLADEGKETEFLNHEMFPEFALILEANRNRPGSVVNHLGFYPFESAIEKTRHKIHMAQSMERAAKKDLKGAVEELMEAQWALASCHLLRDVELIKQISMLGENVVVLRGLAHTYLLELDRLSIPIANDSRLVLDFHEIVRRKGIAFAGEVEPLELSFSEQVIKKMCSAEIEKDEHQRLALLEIMYVGFIEDAMSAWESPDARKAAYNKALEGIDSVSRELYG